MELKKLQFHNYIISEQATIKEAMAAITDNQRGAVVVVDAKLHLLGVASDGELRRALVAGRDFTSPISEILNYNPVVVSEGGDSEDEARKIFKESTAIHLIPVINSLNKIVDVIIRNPAKRK